MVPEPAEATGRHQSTMGKGADRRKRNQANRRARGETWSEIRNGQGPRRGAAAAWAPAARGMVAAALPPLSASLLGVEAERLTTQPAGPSQAQFASMEVDVGVGGGVEPPNAGRVGEEYAAAWLRHQHATATVRWLNDTDEQHADHDIEILAAAAGETEWRHVEVKTRWAGCDPRMNQLSHQQRVWQLRHYFRPFPTQFQAL